MTFAAGGFNIFWWKLQHLAGVADTNALKFELICLYFLLKLSKLRVITSGSHGLVHLWRDIWFTCYLPSGCELSPAVITPKAFSLKLSKTSKDLPLYIITIVTVCSPLSCLFLFRGYSFGQPLIVFFLKELLKIPSLVFMKAQISNEPRNSLIKDASVE